MQYRSSVVLLFTFALALPTAAQVQPFFDASGRLTLSLDADGNNEDGGGAIAIEKPAGATVRRAFLSAAGNFERVIGDGDVSLAGTPVHWEASYFNAVSGRPRFFHNVLADVTAIVAPVVDAAPAGQLLLTVTEVSTVSIDGVILAVVFDDLGASPTWIELLFGGQSVFGDQFVVDLPAPFDPGVSGAVLDMSLGISFSGVFMTTEVEVNGTRLTSAAGGLDDGVLANGGLITVGGIGDSNANPADPFNALEDDDELYDLLPFVDATDSQVVVDTNDLTQGDNLFFAAVCASLACPVTLDFETEDDLATPLVNGQHIDTEFGNLVTITSTGANAGLGIFCSTPAGPNDPSQDLDLLVDSGNLLILQTENFSPNGDDVFPRPNDDEDGGTITFAFSVPVEAREVRLIDIDASDPSSSVVLTDGGGRQRTYTVPGNWTGDLAQAQPGEGTLDLSTLLPQPGFASIAMAVEDEDFDPTALVRIDVQLGGSGGIDDLDLCLTTGELAAASMTHRNGTGSNPMILGASSMPVLGREWTATLDCSRQSSGTATLKVRRFGTAGTFAPFGEVLIHGPLLYRSSQGHSGSASPLSWPIPFDISLCGLEVHAQGSCSEARSVTGQKRMRVGGVLSNALDLVLGF